MAYNPNIHHRRSIRLKGHDYSQPGLYFITICCHNRQCLFGEIVGAENFLPDIDYSDKINSRQKMILNDAGKIANEYWLEIPKHFNNAILHEHVVMPNHIHGIIELSGVDNVVGVENFQPLQQRKNEFQKMIPRSIGSIVKGFKIGVTKWFRTNTNLETVWQRNYHEHIIHNEQSYQTISNYIIDNPANWKKDKFNK
jgi:putative transposase